MKLQVNGDAIDVPSPCNLSALIEQLGLSGRRLAVEMNGEIVPRSQYQYQTLSDGDQLEIVQAIGGG